MGNLSTILGGNASGAAGAAGASAAGAPAAVSFGDKFKGMMGKMGSSMFQGGSNIDHLAAMGPPPQLPNSAPVSPAAGLVTDKYKDMMTGMMGRPAMMKGQMPMPGMHISPVAGAFSGSY